MFVKYFRAYFYQITQQNTKQTQIGIFKKIATSGMSI